MNTQALKADVRLPWDWKAEVPVGTPFRVPVERDPSSETVNRLKFESFLRRIGDTARLILYAIGRIVKLAG